MPLQNRSRRRLLAGTVAMLAGSAGCLSGSPEESADSAPESEATTTPTNESAMATATGTPPERLTELSVADFIQYPLSGTHPTVHRKAGQQYVVVRLEPEARNHVTLQLDGEAVERASRQPVEWMNDTVDTAFAVSKDRTVERGELRLGGATWQLSPGTISRLNEPPEFELGRPSVSPAEIEAGETVLATVSVTVANRGDGAGTFGASLSGNYVSGSTLVTASLQPGEERELTPSIRIHGEGNGGRVSLDWGVDRWATDVPVAGTETP